MDWSLPAEAEAFRAEVRAWLDVHLTERFHGLGFSGDPTPEVLERMHEWNRVLADAGYAAIAWPEEYGGRGAGVLDQVVLAEELHRAGAPATLNPLGLSNIAPAIMQFGTEDQKRSLLPSMLRGDHIWCQGFSEPEAGSDLASLRTRAVLDGDSYVVDGQKVWTTFGQLATHCELLVRTDPDAPKHKGITCLLVDLASPGVEVLPLVTITGEREFNEIFFTGVRVPVTDRLGPEHEGWGVAVATLTAERGGVANLYLGVQDTVARLLEAARSTGRADDPLVRHGLAQVWVRAQLLERLADRAVSAALHDRPAGPETSVAKLVWSELGQDLGRLAGEILGPDADGGRWGRDRVYSRALSIVGGTTQINKTVIATRILGLPRR